MGLIIDLHETVQVNMGVLLGGREAGMPQEFLNSPQICPSFE
jgi:hypothetical protein